VCVGVCVTHWRKTSWDSHTPCIVATRKIPPTSKRSTFSITRLKKSTKDLRAFHFQKEKSFLQKENAFECDPLTQTNPMRLTSQHAIATTSNLTSKPLNRQRSSSSQLARKRACVMFQKTRTFANNKNNTKAQKHALVSRRAGILKIFISGRATTEPGWRRPRYLTTYYCLYRLSECRYKNIGSVRFSTI
jgi:hypothetical protein